MGRIVVGVIIGVLGTILITGIIGKGGKGNEVGKIKAFLGVDENADLKELTSALEKLKQRLETFEKETNLLREEKNKLEQQLKVRDEYIAEMTNKFIAEGLKGEFAKKTDDRKTAPTPQTQKNAEGIIQELENAIAKKDWLKVPDLILELIKMGPAYYQKVLEFATKLQEAWRKAKKEIGEVYATASDEEKKKLGQKIIHDKAKLVPKLFGFLTDEEFIKFSDWVINTNGDIDVGNFLFNVIEATPMIDKSRAPKLHNFLKTKLSVRENNEENIKLYGAHLSLFGNTKLLLEDVANIGNPPQVRAACAFALGKRYALGFPSQAGGTDKQIIDKEKVKEQFQNSISNLPDKEILQKYFDLASKDVNFPLGEDEVVQVLEESEENK